MKSDPNIAKFRQQIDVIDNKILQLLNRRAALAQKIGHIKIKNSQPLYVPERERQLLASLTEKNSGPLPNESLQLIYKEIISASLALEAPLGVAYLGVEATFSFEACKRHFGLSARFKSCQTIAEVFTEVEKGRSEYGVVPLETSSEGVVSHTLDLFTTSNLQICAEVLLAAPVTHAKANSLSRFLVVGQQSSKPSGRDRTSIMFALKDKPGVLLHVLEPFAKAGINMTRIESRPFGLRDWDYMFYVDFDGHKDDDVVAVCLEQLARLCVFFRILGSYPQSEAVVGKPSGKKAKRK